MYFVQTALMTFQNTTIEVNNITMKSTNLGDNPDFEFYQSIYASTIGLILFFIFLRCLVFTKVGVDFLW